MLISFFRSFAVVAVVGFLAWASPFLKIETVHAGVAPNYFNAILPEDFSLGLFGVIRDTAGTIVPAVTDLLHTRNEALTAAINNDQIFGVSNMLDAGFVDGLYVFYGEDDSGSHSYDMYLTLLDTNADVVGGWPVLVHGGGGFPDGFHSQSGFIKMVPDDNRGVYLMYFTGAEAGFGSVSVELTHFDEAGDQSPGYPINLGEYAPDMIPDGLGGIFVLSEMGIDRDFNLPFTHGKVERYTFAGLDGTWAGGAGEFIVSDYLTSEKYGATLMSDGAGGGFVLWIDEEFGVARYVRAQRFLSTGLVDPNWSSAGDILYGDAPGLDFTFVRGASSGFGNYYATFSEGSNIKTVSFDEDGDLLWSCTQDFGSWGRYTTIGNPDPTDPGVYVLKEDGGVYAQHFEESNGNSTWQIGGENVAFGSDFNAIFPDHGFNLFFENKSTAMVADPNTNGVDLLYSISDPGEQTIFNANFNRASFPAGPGGDCAVGAVPDAIVDLAALAGNTEVDLTWSVPADNGNPIVDYTIEFGETVGFPGNATPFVDGVSAVAGATVTGLTNDTDYSFRVFAENGIGLSVTSNIATATPIGIEGRRRGEMETVQGPRIYLGRLQELFEAAQNFFSGGIHGSSDDDVIYQPSDGGETGRSFSEDEYLRTQVQPEKENLLRLLDLIIQLRHLFGWMSPDDYQLSKEYVGLSKSYEQLFLTRFFHQMTGVEYLKRGPGVYEFDYRDPIHQPTVIVADFQKSILLSYGKACYGSQVLEYAEEIDFVGNPDWFKRYVFIMKPWMDVVLGKNDYVQWTSTRNIDVLESLYLFLFGYCLTDELLS
jgi:hypothetical protein